MGMSMNTEDSATFHHAQMLDLYEKIAGHALAMEDAAASGDWERVMQLERQCAILVMCLRQHDTSVPLSVAQRERKVMLITQILRSDAHVRSMAQPVMNALHHQLADTRRGSRMHQAYGRVARF
jgi:flagellar protein FliT